MSDSTRPAQRKSRSSGDRRRTPSGDSLPPTKAPPTTCASLGTGSTGRPSALTSSAEFLLPCGVPVGHAATAAHLRLACLGPFPGPIDPGAAVRSSASDRYYGEVREVAITSPKEAGLSPGRA